jgi:hypothetical protein
MANVLTNAGRAMITAALKASGYTEATFGGWGTGAGTAAVADTTLFTEKAADLTTGTGTRVTGTTSRVTTSVTNDTWQNAYTITATGAGTVTNAGCFDSSTITAGNLFVKGDFTGIVLASSDSIAFTIKLQFT